MLAIALVVALAAQAPADAPNTVDSLTVEALKKRPPATITDHQIVLQLNALRKAEPDRVVCVTERYSDSYIPRNICGSLRWWYDMEVMRGTNETIARLINDPARNVPARYDPPDELVKLVKERMKARAMAQARARKNAAKGDTAPVTPEAR